MARSPMTSAPQPISCRLRLRLLRRSGKGERFSQREGRSFSSGRASAGANRRAVRAGLMCRWRMSAGNGEAAPSNREGRGGLGSAAGPRERAEGSGDGGGCGEWLEGGLCGPSCKWGSRGSLPKGSAGPLLGNEVRLLESLLAVAPGHG